MASPQLEDGHTKIANELLDALMRVNLSPYEHRVLYCILRKTYGWNKKMDRISYTQFEESTGLNRRHIARSIERLINKNIITTSGNGHKLEYGLQKDYEFWKSLPKLVTEIITPAGNESLPKLVTKGENESLPPGAESLPPGAESLPKEAMKSLPKLVNTKAIKHNKSITKATTTTQSFEDYKESLKKDYPEIDVDKEWEKCQVWWSEGKRKMQRPKSALTNWLERARQIKKDQDGRDNGQSGTNRGNTSGRHTEATEEQLRAGLR